MSYEIVMKLMTNKIAKKAKKALLEIPFYRKKIKEHKIDFSEVRRINSIDKLDEFLNKYRIEWVSEKDLINNNFSLDLSMVPQDQRIWVQASSGYENASRLQQNINKNYSESFTLIRKFVAYSKNDLKEVVKTIYKRGLEELVEDIPSPVIGIFSRLTDLCGSGVYPLIGLSGGYNDVKVKTLYFGTPKNDTQTLQWLLESKRAEICGIITVPSTLERLIKVAEENNIKFNYLRFIGCGGNRLIDPLVEAAHELGAEMVVVGYSAQEVMPLGSVANGILSSNLDKFPETDGLITFGNLCYVRVTDKNGFSVNPGETGEVRITSPFEGTALIDYPIHDITKLIDNKTTLTYKGKKIKAPFTVIDYNIYRDKEYTLRVRERSVNTPLIYELCSEVDNYNFLISSDGRELHIFFKRGVNEKKICELKKRLEIYLPDEVFQHTHIIELSEDVLNQYLYPLGHYKPHNIIKENELLKELLQSLYK